MLTLGQKEKVGEDDRARHPSHETGLGTTEPSSMVVSIASGLACAESSPLGTHPVPELHGVGDSLGPRPPASKSSLSFKSGESASTSMAMPRSTTQTVSSANVNADTQTSTQVRAQASARLSVPSLQPTVTVVLPTTRKRVSSHAIQANGRSKRPAREGKVGRG